MLQSWQKDEMKKRIAHFYFLLNLSRKSFCF
jgi:hypothetical protein